MLANNEYAYQFLMDNMQIQNNLIDEQKLIQLLKQSQQESGSNFNVGLDQLKDNPELLLQMIPSPNHATNRNNLREKLRYNNEQRKRAFIANNKIEKSNSPTSSKGKLDANN